MLPDLLLMLSVGVIVSLLVGLVLGVLFERVAWWRGWDDE